MQESARGSAILITGATGSIGLEIAARTAAEGAVVGVHGSRPESVGGALEKLRRRVPAGQFVPLPADFRENGAIAALVEQFVADAGRLDGVVDCALGGPSGTLREARERFERDYVASVLQHHRGRMGDAAQALGIERTNLYRKIKQLNIRWTAD